MTNFASDNASGASPEIVAALAAANDGPAMPYGKDSVTLRLEARLQEIFETDCAVFPVATGTAANVLGLSLMTPPFGAIFCHADSHIYLDECNAPEFYTGGARLVPLAGEGGKLTVAELADAVVIEDDVRRPQPAAVSLSQVSEFGRVYSCDELAAIGALVHERGLGLHMDGARFTNALVALGCSPAEMTWKAGVDVLSFGATKNGVMAAEAVVVFKPELADSFGYRRKRGGHLFSKMRYLSAQLEAYLTDDLWLANARHANAMAARLAQGLAAIADARLLYPVEANEIFIDLPEAVVEALEAAGFLFYRWDRGAGVIVRLVASFNTKPEEVEAFLATALGAAEAGAAATG